jgi:hypothetical protein
METTWQKETGKIDSSGGGMYPETYKGVYGYEHGIEDRLGGKKKVCCSY